MLFLLYTQPCFELLGGGNFRYKPTPVTSVRKSLKRTDQLARLWEDLLSTSVVPHPPANERKTVQTHLDVPYSLSLTFAPDLELPSHWRQLETEGETAVTALSFAVVEEELAGKTVPKEEKRSKSFLLRDYEPDLFTTRTDATVLMSEEAGEPS